MMESNLKSLEEIRNELGFTRITFYRRRKKLNIELGGGLLTPQKQLEIKRALGFFEPDPRFGEGGETK